MKHTSLRPLFWIKPLIFVSWAILFSLLLKRDVFIDTVNLQESETLRQAESEEYQGIYFRESKIGYVITRYNVGSDKKQLIEQEAVMNLNIAQAVQTITLRLKATLYAGNYLQDFEFSFQSPFYRMQASGTVNGNSVKYLLDTGTNTIRDTLTFPTPPLLATSRRAYLLNEGIQTGGKKRIPWFDPLSLTSKESVLEYRGQEAVLINGRVQKLHHFIESFSGARVNSWLSDAGAVIKEESPAGFIFLKEPKFKALDLSGRQEELLAAVAVKLQGELGDVSGSFKQYRLTIPDESKLDMNGGRQVFLDKVLTVSREELPTDVNAATCPDVPASLAASPYIQSDSPEILKLTKEIIGDTPQPLARIKLLAAWVYQNLEKRPVLGLPDALTTLQSKQGDCNEHAALFAALARAARVPTRIASGVTFHKEAFYYHAWNEICLDNRWISIDTTTNQFPADLTHLRFIVGEMQEQVRLGGLLGTLGIEPLVGGKMTKIDKKWLELSMQRELLNLKNLTKSFGSFTAVDSVSLKLDAGEIYGFLGPNGAGKTTTIKMLAGLLQPSGGAITICGKGLADEPFYCKNLTGYIPDRPYLYEKLTGAEYLGFISSLYSVSGPGPKQEADRYLDLFDLSEWQDHLIEGYSHGMRQKLIMASIFMLNQPLIIIDEPMVGLDPKSARIVKELFKSKAKSGTGIFLSTHSMEIAEELCDRIGIIVHGRIVAEGTMAELRGRATGGNDNLEDIFLELTGASELHAIISALRSVGASAKAAPSIALKD